MTDATLYMHDNTPLEFKRGGRLDEFTIAYETWGTLNQDKSNAALILTGLSPSAHAASSPKDPSPGWWEPMVGPGLPIDTDRFFVISLNSLGSCKGSTGPASICPATGQPWRLDFPDLSVEDIAAASSRVVTHLGITQLCLLVGPSMGGMSTLAYLQQNPQGTRHYLNISGAHKAEPFSIAIRSLQRELIVSDPQWREGQYDDRDWPEKGMRMARKLGMLSYRSAEEWRGRFGRREQNYFPTETFGMNYEVESYLEAAARRFVGSFDPCSYLYLSRSMDWFDATENHPNLTSALKGIELQSSYVLGAKTDILFPPYQQEAIANALSENGIKTACSILPSIMGHDAFLVDHDHFGPNIAAYLQRVLHEDGLDHQGDA